MQLIHQRQFKNKKIILAISKTIRRTKANSSINLQRITISERIRKIMYSKHKILRKENWRQRKIIIIPNFNTEKYKKKIITKLILKPNNTKLSLNQKKSIGSANQTKDKSTQKHKLILELKERQNKKMQKKRDNSINKKSMKTNKSRANKNQIGRVLLIKRQNKTKQIEYPKERK